MDNFSVFGLSRSGSHAIIFWLLDNMSHNVRYVNNTGLNIYKTYDKVSDSVIAHEDIDLNTVTEHHTPVVIMRDPFNLFASRITAVRKNPNFPFLKKDQVYLWKQYARSILDKSFPWEAVINYNKWTSDPEYRKDIINQLGYELHIDNMQRVPVNGKGSSFDGFDFNNRGNEMDVLNRWKHMVDDQEYLSYFDQEIVDLSYELFGPVVSQEFVDSID